MANGDPKLTFTLHDVIVCPGARMIVSTAKLAEVGVSATISDGSSHLQFPNGQCSPMVNHREGGMLMLQT